VEIIAGLNTRIYSSASQAFDALGISPPVRRELIEKIYAWADEQSDYVEHKNGK